MEPETTLSPIWDLPTIPTLPPEVLEQTDPPPLRDDVPTFSPDIPTLPPDLFNPDRLTVPPILAVPRPQPTTPPPTLPPLTEDEQQFLFIVTRVLIPLMLVCIIGVLRGWCRAKREQQQYDAAEYATNNNNNNNNGGGDIETNVQFELPTVKPDANQKEDIDATLKTVKSDANDNRKKKAAAKTGITVDPSGAPSYPTSYSQTYGQTHAVQNKRVR